MSGLKTIVLNQTGDDAVLPARWANEIQGGHFFPKI